METSPEPPPKRFHGLGAVVIFVGIAVMISLFWTQMKQAKQRGQPVLQTFGEVPTWQATSLEGPESSILDSSQMKNSLLVVHFLRSVDTVDAWMVRDRLTQLASILDQVHDTHVRILTFIDGELPNPLLAKDFFAALRQSQFGDMNRHLLLQPLASPTDIQAAGAKEFRHQFFFPTEGQSDGEHLEESATETRFVVIDGNGNIRAYRDGRNPEAAASLLQDIGALVREKSITDSRGSPPGSANLPGDGQTAP